MSNLPTLAEPLPFERQPEDSPDGWLLFVDWLKAPAEMTLVEFAAKHNGHGALVLDEGTRNQWMRRRLAHYRHSAELTSAQAAIESGRLLYQAMKKWQDILGKVADGLDLESGSGMDIYIERMRVLTECAEKANRAATGNKFAIAFIQQNNFGGGQGAGPSKPVLDASWNHPED